MHNADNGHYVLFGLCVAAITLSTVRLHRLPSSLTVAPVKRMRCVDLMPVGCCVWVWVSPRGLFASSGGPCRVVRRRATLPHPVGCSTIAVPGLSFRVRNGTGRLSWAMAAANLGLSAGKRGFPPACGGSGTGQWTRCVLLLTDRARVRTVLPVRLRGALPGPAPHTLAGVWMWVASRPLVPVGSTPRGASTSGLSTTCSAWGLQRLGAAWNPYLGEGFPLRCFQRLSLPNVANRPRHWRDDRHTRGSSTQVLSYYGQASSGFQRAQRIETKLSHDVLNPARVPL